MSSRKAAKPKNAFRNAEKVLKTGQSIRFVLGSTITTTGQRNWVVRLRRCIDDFLEFFLARENCSSASCIYFWVAPGTIAPAEFFSLSGFDFALYGASYRLSKMAYFANFLLLSDIFGTFELAAWRLRNSATWQLGSSDVLHFDSLATWVHDIFRLGGFAA